MDHTRAGRQIVEEGKVVRIVLQMLSEDIAGQLAIPSKVSGGGSSSSTGSTSSASATETTGASNTGATSSTTGSTTSGTTGSSDMSTDSAAQSEDMATETESSGGLFEAGASGNVGVLGYSDRLILVVSRVPKAQSVQPAGNSMGAEDTGEALTDLCRITYWFVDNGDGERGLARHETTRVTSTDEAVPRNVGDPQKYIIADQVAGVSFQYHDGSGWTDSWNGAAMQPDGKTPIGPPAAIAILLTVRRGQNPGTEIASEAVVRHVVAIPTANRMAQSSSTTTLGAEP
jgi:hypothetical protein